MDGADRFSGLSVRVRALAKRLGISDPKQFARLPLNELSEQKNCGTATIRAIRNYLEKQGLDFNNKHYPRSRPIPVSERLPEIDEPVLSFRADDDGLADGGDWAVGFRTMIDLAPEMASSAWVHDGELAKANTVTHWFPLPPKPE